ncbi:hypothetical protein [Streptomyces sp. TBY4]|uniref:hypothetical protein n=1 Tax=Streptomyces sp. TBY4 TaxID=2962030 RepID=UPI0020B8A3DC|nr:hypothetical protein [Streptomyces sp. TBY4]MCP3758225.1 hypothetical protein [Streptomyces sp. TBY4]
MTPEDTTRVAVELAEMRGEIRTGFAEIRGQLGLALQRTDQAEADIDALEQRVEALERARWPLPSLAAVVALGSLGLGMYQLVAK